jgi:hypothetical protein
VRRGGSSFHFPGGCPTRTTCSVALTLVAVTVFLRSLEDIRSQAEVRMKGIPLGEC